MKLDNLQIEILADGTIKTTTDQVSGPNHQTAEQFLKMVAQLTGGETTRTKRKESHSHVHSHERGHEHA